LITVLDKFEIVFFRETLRPKLAQFFVKKLLRDARTLARWYADAVPRLVAVPCFVKKSPLASGSR